MQEEIRVAYGKAVRAIRQDKKISQEELGDLYMIFLVAREMINL